MGFIFGKYGCPSGLNKLGCWGPQERWELFRVPLLQYPQLIFIALIISGILFLVLYLINLRKYNIPNHKNFKISLFVFGLVMLIQVLFLMFIALNTVY
jgi:hypothetical protein